MGSTGITMGLEVVGDSPASKTVLRAAILDFLRMTWDRALPPLSAKTAWSWIGLGSDSLLTLFDSGDEGNGGLDEPIEDLTFWFYGTVEWPEALAKHWLALALRERQVEFEQLLREHGYLIKADAVYPNSHQRFVVDSQRIGCPNDKGVYWQLPDYDYEGQERLPNSLWDRAKAVREGAPCECPYCIYLGRTPE